MNFLSSILSINYQKSFNFLAIGFLFLNRFFSKIIYNKFIYLILLFKNINFIFIRKLIILFLFFILSSCWCDEDSINPEGSVPIQVPYLSTDSILYDVPANKIFTLNSLAEGSSIRINASGMVEKTTREAEWLTTERVIDTYYLDDNAKFEVDGGRSYKFIIEPSDGTDLNQEGDNILLGYVLNNDIDPNDIKVKVAPIEHLSDSTELTLEISPPIAIGDKYKYNISIKNNNDGGYVFKKLQFVGTNECNNESNDNTLADAERELKTETVFWSASNACDENDFNTPTFLKKYKITSEYSGFIRFKDSINDNGYILNDNKAVLLEDECTNKYDNNDIHCPYLKKGETIILLEDSITSNINATNVTIKHMPYIVCGGTERSKTTIAPNLDCNNSIFYGSDDNNGKCYECDICQECSNNDCQIIDGSCNTIILSATCLNNNNYITSNVDCYQFNLTGTENNSDDIKQEIYEIYEACAADGEKDREIIIDSKYYDCEYDNNINSNQILRFYKATKVEDGKFTILFDDIESNGYIFFFWSKSSENEYPYNTSTSDVEATITNNYNINIGTNGKDLTVDIINTSGTNTICSITSEYNFINGALRKNNLGNLGITVEEIGNICGDDLEDDTEFKFQFALPTDYTKGSYDIDIYYTEKAIFSETAKTFADSILSIFYGCQANEGGCGNDPKEGLVENFYESFINSNNYKNLVRIFFSLFMVFFGISYFFGLTEFKIKELLPLIVKIGIIYLFIDPDMGFTWFKSIFVNGFKEGLDSILSGISNIFSGFSSPSQAVGTQDEHQASIIHGAFSVLDVILSIEFIWKMVFLLLSFPFGSIVFALLVYPAWISYLSMVMIVISTYFIAQIMIALLFIFAPIFFIMLLFKSTKTMFDLWFRSLIGFSFQQIMIFITFGFFNVLILGMVKITFSYNACFDDLLLNNMGSFITLLASLMNPSAFVSSISGFIFFYFFTQIALKMVNQVQILAASMSDSISFAGISKNVMENAAILKKAVTEKAVSGFKDLSKELEKRGHGRLADIASSTGGAVESLSTGKFSTPDFIESGAFNSGEKDELKREMHDARQDAIDKVKKDIENSNEFKKKTAGMSKDKKNKELIKELKERKGDIKEKLKRAELKSGASYKEANKMLVNRSLDEDKYKKSQDKALDKQITKSVEGSKSWKDVPKDIQNEFAKSSNKSYGGIIASKVAGKVAGKAMDWISKLKK